MSSSQHTTNKVQISFTLTQDLFQFLGGGIYILDPDGRIRQQLLNYYAV